MSQLLAICLAAVALVCGPVEGIRTRFNSTCMTDMLGSFGLERHTVRIYEKKLGDGKADIYTLRSKPSRAVMMLERYGIFESAERARLLLCLTAGQQAFGCDVPNPCQNEGRCVFSQHSYDKFICDCRPGYKGHSCQFDVCNSDPCQHHGSCFHSSEGYECRCKPGFAGPNCEIDQDECLSSPCTNGGTCVDLENGFRCKCQPEYGGKRCHKRSLTLEDFTTLRNTVEELERNLETVSNLQQQPAASNNPSGRVQTNSAGLDQPCQGIIGWRYVPWSSWRSGEDQGSLRLENYVKKRDDTYLKITFNSVLMQNAHDQCAQWSIHVDGKNCSEPAPIQTVIHTFHSQEHNNYADRRPAQVMGMCRASDRGPLLRGSHAISVHVGTCPGYDSADASTGWADGLTSFLMVEEYCPPN
ncbi:uncharacterized protein LOC135825914 isoform X2 [Sycon ciliatum]|uniref:uncharacterized protein LOC135825914 isoform X2 n=1 Tax=Sycon ciliatum TaxID=27933 RepID=UPI0031F5F1FC